MPGKFLVPNIFTGIFTSREAARSREGVIFPEEGDVCQIFDSCFMVAYHFVFNWLEQHFFGYFTIVASVLDNLKYFQLTSH